MKLKNKQDLLYEEIEDTWEHKLCAAIIYRACIDYEDILFKYLIEPNDKSKERLKPFVDEVKIFFGSDWYYFLTNINHNQVLKEIELKARIRAEKHSQKSNYYIRRHQFVWGVPKKGDDKD